MENTEKIKLTAQLGKSHIILSKWGCATLRFFG
jgi:hypothetical protein